MQSAERFLDCTLFSWHPVAPTAACLSVLPEVRVLLADADRLAIKLSQLVGQPRGFQLAIPCTVRLGLGRQMLGRWKEEFPQLEVILLEGEDDEIRGWLKTGVVDAGVLINPGPEIVAQGVEVVSDVFEAVVHRDHPLAQQRSIGWDDILEDRLALSDSGCRSQVEALCRRCRPEFHAYLLVRDLRALVSMVASGQFATILPSICDPAFPLGGPRDPSGPPGEPKSGCHPGSRC